MEEEARAGTWDIRLAYGRLPDEDLVQEDLCRDEVRPLCAPSHPAAMRGETFTSARAPDLIHTQWGPSYGSNVTWKDWFQHAAPRERIDMGAGHEVNASRAALALAEAGAGIALGQMLLASDALAEGRLVALSTQSLQLGQSYVIALAAARARQTEVQTFRTWLLDEVRPTPRDLPPSPPATPHRQRKCPHRVNVESILAHTVDEDGRVVDAGHDELAGLEGRCIEIDGRTPCQCAACMRTFDTNPGAARGQGRHQAFRRQALRSRLAHAPELMRRHAQDGERLVRLGHADLRRQFAHDLGQRLLEALSEACDLRKG